MASQKDTTPSIPARLVAPVAAILRESLKLMKKRFRELKKEDPFTNTDRASDNAALDTDAQEQFGHERTAAIRQQLEEKIKQTQKALKRIKAGKYGQCEDCGNLIDTDRLAIYPEATICVSCEKKREKRK